VTAHDPSASASSTPASARSTRPDLTRFAWLSIAAALVTIALKTGAWWLTDSVGLLSDAAESTVNLVAAVVALIALRIAARPADDTHHYGHAKAEFFSAAAEGTMIFAAAIFILYAAVQRFLDPQPVENVGVGLAVSVVASVINGAVALVLLRAGREHRSLTLTADGKHLMTDVWTSAGVVLGVVLVAVTGIQRLDPLIAAFVGLNIIWAGWRLLQESAEGLMDPAMAEEDNTALAALLSTHAKDGVHFHGLRTRQSGHLSYAEVHVLVPGAWSVKRAHDLVEVIEADVANRFAELTLSTHIEPSEDPRSYEDFEHEVPVEPVNSVSPIPPVP
jgi:cation diffusion facilitator family transporter